MAEPDTDRVVNRPLATAAVAAFVGMLAVSVWAHTQLPADALVPTRWNFDGEITSYMGRTGGLFLTVLLFPLVVGVLWLVPRIEPRRANLARSAVAYRATVYGVIAFYAALHVLIVSAAMGYAADVTRFVAIGVGALMVVVGNWLPKVRSNFLFGIRTPWTLTSEHTWRRTHRVGGRAFVAFGLLAIAAGLVLPSQALGIVLAAGAAVVTVGVLAYSYVVWRSAPDRHAHRRSA